MRAQRVRVGESRMEMQSAKWAAEGAVKSSSDLNGREDNRWLQISLVACDVGHTSVAGNMKVFRKVYGSYRKSRWHRG